MPHGNTDVERSLSVNTNVVTKDRVGGPRSRAVKSAVS